jgi:hypothetical protein
MATTSEAVSKIIPPTDSRLWVSDSGDIVCDGHAGAYLKSAIEAHPRKSTHTTPLDTWSAYNHLSLGALPCSTCVDWMTIDLSPQA